MGSHSHSRFGDEETNSSTTEETNSETGSTSEIDLSDLGLTLPKEHWSTGYINYLIEKEGIAESAKNNQDFLDLLHVLCDSPDYTASRGDIVEFLIFLTELDPETPYENTRPEFLDADSSDPQWKYIEMAYQLGLVDGYPDGLFRSKQIINRAETLKMVMRFFKEDVGEKVFGEKLLVRYNLDSTPLPDIDIKEWYAPYTLFGYTKGVVHGYKDGTFGPANSVSFAELLKIALLTQDIDNAIELSSELE